jgi:hypothetical protein
VTVSASAVLAIYTASTTFALGLSSVLFTATGLVLFESVLRAATEDGEGSRRGLVSANGTVSRRASISNPQRVQRLATLRDVAIAIIVVCGIASILMESSLVATSVSWEPVYSEYAGHWRDVHNFRVLQRFLWTIPVHGLVNLLVFIMVRTTFYLNCALFTTPYVGSERELCFYQATYYCDSTSSKSFPG